MTRCAFAMKMLSAFAVGGFWLMGAQAALSAPSAPTGSWVVGPIQAPSSSGVSYCSMKNDYASGHTLVFARDAAGGNSIALDFGKKSAVAGSQHLVTLQVGPIRRMMVAIAATTEILIVQMGQDSDFYDMLRRKNALDVEFNGHFLSFSLNGTADALEALGNCASAMGGGKPFKEATLPASSLPIGADQAAKPVGGYLAAAAAEMHAVPAAKAAQKTDTPNEDIKIGEQALQNSLLEEVKKLRAENHRLLVENQAVAARMRDEDLDQAEKDIARVAELERREKSLQIENQRMRDMMASMQQDIAPVAAQAEPAAAQDIVVPVRAPIPPQVTEVAAIMPAPAVRPVPQGLMARVMAVMSPGQSPSADADIWRGQSGDVFISVQSLPVAAEGDARARVGEYIQQMQARCAGDFAHKLSQQADASAPFSVMTGEVACVDAENDAAAALTFLADEAHMVVVTHEGLTETVAATLSERERFLSMLYLKNRQ